MPNECIRTKALGKNIKITTHIEGTSPDYPFMNDMDEIAYWVCTKKAPCLYQHDIKYRNATLAQHKPSGNDYGDDPVPDAKKRRMDILDDESMSEEQKIKFFVSPHALKSDSHLIHREKTDSSLEFHITKDVLKPGKYSYVVNSMCNSNNLVVSKPKLPESCYNKVDKIRTLNTSTPKVVHTERPKRSRKVGKINMKNLSQSSSSLDIFSCNTKNKQLSDTSELVDFTLGERKSVLQNTPLCEHEDQYKKNKIMNVLSGAKNNTQLEDSSDVSGFTANYIRSTKIQKSKMPSNSANCYKNKVSKKSRCRQNKTVINVNKSINTELPLSLNCSSDSSQNVINLMTRDENAVTSQLNASTSVLNFIGTKVKDIKRPLEKKSNYRNIGDENNLINFSLSSKRNKTHNRKNSKKLSLPMKEDNIKIIKEISSSNHKECSFGISNIVTRSHRKALDACNFDDPVVVVSPNSINVARHGKVKKKSIKDKKDQNSGKAANKRRQVLYTNIGLSSFSDSDDDKSPKLNKFFR